MIRNEFPCYANTLRRSAPWIIPGVSMRYSLYPALQHEINLLRYQQQQDQANQPRKRGRPPKNPPAATMPPPGAPIIDSNPPKKKAKTDTIKYKRISNRIDKLDDVKELVTKTRKEANDERRAMKQNIARLEKKVVLTEKKSEEKEKPTPPSPEPQLLPPPKPRPSKPTGPPATFESRFKELEDFKRANNHTRAPRSTGALGK